MKLLEVLLKPEYKLPAIGTTSLKDPERFALSLEDGLVRVQVLQDRESFKEPFLIPLVNCVYIKAAPKEAKVK